MIPQNPVPPGPPVIGPIPLREIYSRLHCSGYWGLGAGFALARGQRSKASGVSLCNSCPLTVPCWAGHKKRVESLWPVAAEEFETLAKAVGGPQASSRWIERYKCPDPYSGLLLANVEDGGRLAGGLLPLNRGPTATIAWPLPEGPVG